MENTEMEHPFRIKICSLALGSMMAFSVLAAKPAAAGPDTFVGELMLIGDNFCPLGYVDANGQLLSPIAAYDDLYQLFGTMYGGDGRSTFGVPDLRGRVPISAGQGSGLANYWQGQKGGAESFTLQTKNLASHNHRVQAMNAIANNTGASR